MLKIKQSIIKPLINSKLPFNNFYKKQCLKNITFELRSKQIDVNVNK